MMFLFLLLLGRIFHSSDALVLTKLARAYHYYLKNEKSFPAHDPLDGFTLQRRIQLCDDVLNAKQFMTKYHASQRMKQLTSGQKVKLTEWNLPTGVPNSDLNYQRSISSQRGGEDSELLQYNSSHVRITGGTYKTIKKLQCVDTPEIDWFVTYGLVDDSMYLIERNKNDLDKTHRMVGILEENPVQDDREFEHFQRQHEKYRDEMESICLLGIDDHLRFCGAVLDTLDNLGSLTRTVSKLNYVKYRCHPCVKKGIKMHGRISRQFFLRCSFFLEHDDEPSTMFYALADPSEEGAAFVFLEDEDSVVTLYTRMVQIRALVNPTGPRKVKLIATGGEEEMNQAENQGSGGGETSPFISWRVRQTMKHEAELRWRLKQDSLKTKDITPEDGSSNEKNFINQKKRKNEQMEKRKEFRRNAEEGHKKLSDNGEEIQHQFQEHVDKDLRDLGNVS